MVKYVSRHNERHVEMDVFRKDNSTENRRNAGNLLTDFFDFPGIDNSMTELKVEQ